MRAVAGILLAAGESRRMGFPKPLLRFPDGQTFVDRISRAMLSALPHLVVVVGAHSERVRDAIAKDQRITIVENRDWERGQLSSIKCALRTVDAKFDAAVIHLIDHPSVTPSTFAAVRDAWNARRTPIVVARHNGRRGHPVLFDRSLFDELLDAPEDRGARVVVNAEPSRVSYVDVDDPGVTLDLDTPEDLARAGFPPAPAQDN